MTQEEKKEELIDLFCTGAIFIGDLIDECFEFGQQHPSWISMELWKDAGGNDLPVYDREVIVLIQDYPDDEEHLRVAYGHRPNPKGYVSINGEEVYAQTYGKGGWNGKNVRWWLDCILPNQK